MASGIFIPVFSSSADVASSSIRNLKYYTFATKDDMDDMVDLFDSIPPNTAKTLEVSPRSHQKVVNFVKKESPESAKFKAFS